MPRQRRNICPSFPQRWHRDREYMQAVEQVVAEATLLHVGDQVAVGRGDQPDIDLDRLARADRLDLAFLESAKELDLSGRR